MTDYTSWHVGMKVVCVDATGWRGRLTEGAVYTVSAIGRGGFLLGDRVYVGLEETPSHNELHWLIERFRPAQKCKTSIEIFERLLTNPHVRIEEDA